MRPIIRGPAPTRNPSHYDEYKDDLTDRLGYYCSYCESKLTRAATHVEHIRPKEIHPHLERDWDNLLLACTHCNSIKGKSDVDLNEYLWPDRDNTFRALNYSEGGVITPAMHGEIERKAQNTIARFGLDRVPGHRKFSPKDDRYERRRVAWDKAIRAKENLSRSDTPEQREGITELAQALGFWSIWMTVFKDEPDMLQRLLNAFPGTCKSCFDASNAYTPVARYGGQC